MDHKLKRYLYLINYKDIAYIFALFALPNLFALGASHFIGATRPIFFYEYLVALLPLLAGNKRSFRIYAGLLTFIILLADISLLILSKFNFNIAAALNTALQSQVDTEFLTNLAVSFIGNDLKNAAVYPILLIIFLMGISAMFAALKKYSDKQLRANFISFLFIPAILMAGGDRLKEYKDMGYKWADIYLADCLIISSLFERKDEDWSGAYKGVFKMKPVKQPGTKMLFDHLNQGKMEYDKIFVVVVESFGEFIDAGSQQAIYSALDDEDLRKNYNVTFSKIPFRGATVAAEFRELCSIQYLGKLPNKKYKHLLKACLPAKLNELGFETYGIHNAHGKFYDRKTWYPYMEFKHVIFRNELEDEYKTSSECGAFFIGACDDEIIEKVITPAALDDKKSFVHFMTLEGHVPVEPVIKEPEAFKAQCSQHKPLKEYPALCRYSAIHYNLLQNLKEMAKKIAKKPIGKKVIFVITGDHKPPFYHHEFGDVYKDGVVPLIIIESK